MVVLLAGKTDIILSYGSTEKTAIKKLIRIMYHGSKKENVSIYSVARYIHTMINKGKITTFQI